MIRSIVFDMGNVILRFDPDMFMEELAVLPVVVSEMAIVLNLQKVHQNRRRVFYRSIQAKTLYLFFVS